MVVVVRDKVRVLGLLLVVFDHRLYIRQHVLPLSEALVLLLALLYAGHHSVVSDHLIACSVVLLVATCCRLNPVDSFEEATAIALLCVPLPLIVLSLFLVLLIAAVVALLLLFMAVVLPVVVVTLFKGFYLALKL